MLVSLDLTFESTATECGRKSNWFSGTSAGQNIGVTDLKPNTNQQHPSTEGQKRKISQMPVWGDYRDLYHVKNME